jgi:hypothetical protein
MRRTPIQDGLSQGSLPTRVRQKADTTYTQRLAELILALPRQVIRSLRALIVEHRKDLARPRINLTPMSDDWLRRYEAGRARRRDIQ